MTKILRLEINNTAPIIDLSKCLKSWDKVKFNGEVVETIPSNTTGIIEIENAVALDIYDFNNNFGKAFWNDNLWASALVSFGGDLDTSNVTSMFGMFSGCQVLTSLDVSNFDTSKVTNMSNMFCRCDSLTSLDLSSFDTSNVTNMESMFQYVASLTSLDLLDLSNFNTSNVTNMNYMFERSTTLTNINLSSFNTSNVTSMNSIFNNCTALISLDLSSFDTSNVTSMEGMFLYCTALTSLDLSNFNTSNVTDMGWMFYNCLKLTTLDLIGKDVTLNTVQKISVEANKLTQMKTIYVSDSSKHEGLEYANITYGYPKPKILRLEINNTSSTIDLSKCLKSWDKVKFNGEVVETIPLNTEGIIEIENAIALDVYDFDNNFEKAFFYEEIYGIYSSLISFGGDLDTGNTISMEYMFNGCHALSSLDVSSFNTNKVTNMSNMFSACRALSSLNVSSFDTSNVTNMNSMFYGCMYLTSLDLSNFNTSKVTNMNSMFYNCSALTSLDLSSFNISSLKIEEIRSVFGNCYNLKTVIVNSDEGIENVNFFYEWLSADVGVSCGAIITNNGHIYDKNNKYLRIEGSNWEYSALGEIKVFNGFNIISTYFGDSRIYMIHKYLVE